MPGTNSARAQAAQARVQDNLDRALRRTADKLDRLIEEEAQEMLFAVVMDSGDLSLAMLNAIRGQIRALRADRALCNRTAVEICRRRIAVLLAPNMFAEACERFARWSKN